MNCEQVEELLSAYLDNALALEERLAVATHLQGCSHCSTILADFQRLDALLSQQPRVSPDPALRDRIFSSLEYLELTGTFDSSIGRGHDTGSALTASANCLWHKECGEHILRACLRAGKARYGRTPPADREPAVVPVDAESCL